MPSCLHRRGQSSTQKRRTQVDCQRSEPDDEEAENDTIGRVAVISVIVVIVAVRWLIQPQHLSLQKERIFRKYCYLINCINTLKQTNSQLEALLRQTKLTFILTLLYYTATYNSM